MKQKKLLRQGLAGLLSLSVIAGGSCIPIAAAEETTDFSNRISDRFQIPEAKYQMKTRWWLAEGSHTDETLIESIQELQDYGIGALEIATLNESDYLDDATYAWGSEEWIHDSHLILKECTKRGIGVSFTSGTHWATANLMSIHPDEEAASQELGYQTASLSAGEHFQGALPTVRLISTNPFEGDTPLDSTKTSLVAVVAVKSVDAESNILDAKSLVDLTAQAVQDENGEWTIDYTAPDDGDYLLFAFWQYGTSESYKPAVSKSYTINYFSREGVDALIKYWQDDILDEEMRSLAQENGNVSIFMDSLELNTHGADSTSNLWCADYLEEFKTRRGYDLTPYLPFIILDRSQARFTCDDETDDQTMKKIRNDLYQTNTELYQEKCLEPLREWLHTFGITLRAQNSYNQKLEISEPIKSLDLVETESLAFSSEIDRFRGQAGAAHLYDKPYSSESGAIMGDNYKNSNSYYQQIFYTQFAAGVQFTNLHGYSAAYGPEENVKWPGYEGMAAAISERFSKRQPASVDYPQQYLHMARLQQALSSGAPRMDLGILRTDYNYCSFDEYNRAPYETNRMHQHVGVYWEDTALQDAGYTYDYFSPYLLQDTDITCKDGLVQPDGPAYQALLVYQEAMPYDSAVRLLEWAKDGLPVVIVDGPTEENAPNIVQNQSAAITTGSNDGRDEDLLAVMDEIRALDNVACVSSEAEAYDALIGLGVHPRAEYTDASQQNLVSVLREDDDVSYLYLYNYMYNDTENYAGQVSVEGNYQPYILDTWSGDVIPADSYSYENGRTILNVDLKPGDTMLFALDPAADTAAAATDTASDEASADQETIPLTDWNLNVESWEPGQKETRSEDRGLGYVSTEATYLTEKRMIDVGTVDLIPWKEMANVGEEISGIGYYTNTFTLPDNWTSDTSKVTFQADSFCGGTAALFINDQQVSLDMDAGTADITSYVAAGDNTIEVRVTTNLRNRLIKEEWFSLRPDDPPMETVDYGMVGEATLTLHSVN